MMCVKKLVELLCKIAEARCASESVRRWKERGVVAMVQSDKEGHMHNQAIEASSPSCAGGNQCKIRERIGQNV